MEIEKMKVQKGVHPENREVHFRAPVALERGRAVRSYNPPFYPDPRIRMLHRCTITYLR